MKRHADHHPKMYALADALGLERWGAAGIMACLWQWAAKYGRRGDVGKHANQVIADGVGWRGDPKVLIDALVSCRWLDECECHRLRIHDWPEHAEQSVKKTEEVKAHGFLRCYGGRPKDVAQPSKGRPASGSLPEDIEQPDGRPPDRENPPPAEGRRHRADGTGQTAEGGRPREAPAGEPPPTPATPREAAAVALARLGPPGEAAEAAELRRQINALLDELCPLLKLGRDVLQHRATRTPTGGSIVNLESCNSVPWLRTALDKLIQMRLAHAADQPLAPRPSNPPADMADVMGRADELAADLVAWHEREAAGEPLNSVITRWRGVRGISFEAGVAARLLDRAIALKKRERASAVG